MANTSPMMNPNSAAIMQNNRFSFTSMVASKPVDSPYGDGSSTGLRPCGFNIEPAKKKRGRPRKYAPMATLHWAWPNPYSFHCRAWGRYWHPIFEPPAKRNRGRPPGSGKKQLDALGAAGVGFTPHVITVNVGEVWC
ncbi:AT-hook motif nuclear-localized protein 8 [Vitis vinifera]|uniref:AT-hook motif nuclear-localized protein n=1 Tax=Vitis vinifera TaxID=29760 RepID=A0A438EQC8_VITVI|nr:AT-hook motif nuclear-localized protein 8 [Vitis vinifera]